MKKNTLFKIIAITAFVLAVLSWILPASATSGTELASLGLVRVSLYEFLYYPLLAVQFFLQPLLFVLAVGGLYGVLNETGKYRNILEKIAKSLKGKETVFLILTSLILGVLNSIFGLNLLLFTIIPMLCGIIILMGYNKTTAFLTTFISTFIGVIGSTYGVYVTGYINDVLGTSFSTELVAKIALFALCYIVYASFLVKYAKSSKEKTKEEKEEDNKDELIFIGEKKQSKKPSWPIFVVMGILLLLTILGCTKWSDVFGVTFFTDLHKAVTEWSIKDYTIISYLITDLSEFGKWYFTEMTVMVVVASLILSLVYKLKIEGGLQAFGRGAVKILKPAALIVFAYLLTIITAYHPYFVTITDWMMNLSAGVSGILGELLYILFASINTIISSALNIEMLYVVQSSLQYVSPIYKEATNSLAIITQSLYGLTLFIAPTSTMLILGLEYMGISYKEWIKTSWKLILQLLAVILIIIAVVVFI